jgi:LPS-assembly protein
MSPRRLPCHRQPCYGSGLKRSITRARLACAGAAHSTILLQILRNIFGLKCHELFSEVLLVSLSCIVAFPASAQVVPAVKVPRAGGPPPDQVFVSAVTQEAEGSMYRLRGAAVVETTEMILKADEIDYDQQKGYAEARGNVKFDHFAGGEHLEADRVEYDLKNELGKYYNVKGSSPAKIEARPGVLTTTSPFSFEAQWAERIKNRYVLHEGFITNCKLPKPWWTLRGSEFDVIPGDRAIARNSVFWLKRVPLFYTPRFYKALDRAPRKSGFLTPNIGTSSRRGKMIGGGYYWAINRSYDATYRAQLFTQRGVAHHVDFRGKPNDKTEFNYILYGVKDRGFQPETGERRPPESGYLMTFSGRSDLGHGFTARADVNYLSSFAFRQAFTESFYEAIFSEVHSTGYVSKHWSSFDLNFIATRVENFISSAADDKVSLRRLPAVEFRTRDRQITDRILPVWVSFDSSASLLRRHQSSFETAQFVERLDVEPRITTALRWKEFNLVPSFSLRETSYGSTRDDQGRVSGKGLLRSSREFAVDLSMPSISRVFEKPPSWLGKRAKHVIEPRASFRYVSGIDDDFQRVIRFDDAELLSNTKELEISLTNRLYVKRSGDTVEEALTWTVAQQRYFDPTFGGAIVEGQRNVILSSVRMTGYTFFDAPRNFSPIVSVLRGSPRSGLGFEWRTDYDPARGHFVNSGLRIDGRVAKNYFVSVGHNQVRSAQVLSPKANQLNGILTFGQENRRGWSAGFMAVYDYTQSVMQWAQTQVTYNTDCCGWSVQYRRFGVARQENQFRVAFLVANIGSFGTLKRQERMF